MADSLLKTLADMAEAPNGHGHAADLYRCVAQRVRSLALTDGNEAETIARWFDRLAAGEDPRKVFVTRSRGGRPRGLASHARTKKSTDPKGEKPRTDKYDIAHIVHQAMRRRERGELKLTKAEIYRKVGQAHRLKPGTVRNIYSELKAEVSKLQDGWT